MTDDQQDQQDQQDRSLAEALAVAPLDDVTRRRLVRNALDAADTADNLDDAEGRTGRPPSPGRRSWAPLAAAAVVVILVIGGIVALSRGGDDSSTDTAARKNSPQVADEATGTAPGTGPRAAAGVADSSSGAESFVAGTRLLGDLGDLSIPATRSSVRTAISGADPPTGDVPESVAARVASAACSAPLRASDVTIVGIGTATVDGDDAAVVVTRAADGSETAFVLVFSPCSLTPL